MLRTHPIMLVETLFWGLVYVVIGGLVALGFRFWPTKAEPMEIGWWLVFSLGWPFVAAVVLGACLLVGLRELLGLIERGLNVKV